VDCEECTRLSADYDRLNKSHLSALGDAEAARDGTLKRLTALRTVSNKAWLDAEIARLELKGHRRGGQFPAVGKRRIQLGHKMNLLFAIVFLLAVPLLAPGADEDCTGSTLTTTNCLFEHYKAADAILNTVYQKALKSAGEYGQRDIVNLKDAQQKWIAYRDAACQAEYSLFGGGSGGPAEKAMCLLRITVQRTQDLKRTYLLDDKSK